MRTIIRMVILVFFYFGVSPCLAAAPQATMTIAPLPQLVQTSPVIVTGKIIKAEADTIGKGIDRVTCYLQVDEIIKGKPYLTSTEVLGKRVKTIAFSYEDGASVSGSYWRHNVAEDGLWFMSNSSPSPQLDKSHPVRASYYDVYGEDRTRVAAVKELLRQAAHH